MSVTRRGLLKASAGGLVVGLAGCLSEPGDDGESSDGTDDQSGVETGEEAETDLSGKAAFFTVWDWTRQVSGGSIEIEDVVSVGQMGHGWEPPGDITLDIVEHDFFVYLDTPEFQWAQNTAEQVAEEGVPTIDTMEAIDRSALLAWDADPAPTPDTDHDWDPETFEFGDLDVFHRDSANLVAFWHIDHWDGSLPDVQVDDSMAIDAVFYDGSGRVVPLGDDEVFQVDGAVPDDIPGEETVTVESRGEYVEIQGDEPGRTQIAIQLRAGDELVWESEQGLNVSVVEEDPGDVDGIDDDEIDDDAFYDPHVWVDPVLAQDQVSHIAEELGELDPDNADVYEENAAEYVDRLEEVDRQFREVVEEADTSVAVFAGHDAFQYIEHRYGFQLHSPQGVTPDAEPSPGDIAETLDLVDEHGIDTILYDPFETDDHSPPPLAQRILDETDADRAEPLSPAEGTTADWLEDDWGWIEQMEELNIPSLRAALGAE